MSLNILDVLKDAGSTALENISNQMRPDASGNIPAPSPSSPPAGTAPAQQADWSQHPGSTAEAPVSRAVPTWVWVAAGIGGVLILGTIIMAVSTAKKG